MLSNQPRFSYAAVNLNFIEKINAYKYCVKAAPQLEIEEMTTNLGRLGSNSTELTEWRIQCIFIPSGDEDVLRAVIWEHHAQSLQWP